MKQTWIDFILKRFLQTVLRIFFGEITIVGAEHVPKTGSFVLVANHANALIDPALLIAFLPRPLRFLAKNTLWSVPGLRVLLLTARVIPVYRKQDAGVDTTQNDQTFARCQEALAQGEAIALFPEGLTHSAPSLQPLKTGAARIVISAEDAWAGLTVPILPVGMTFDAKDRFRSRVLIVVGKTFSSQAARSANPDDTRAVVRVLTQTIDTEIRRVTLNYPSWEEAELIEKAAAIYARQVLHPETALRASVFAADQEVATAAEFALRHKFAMTYPVLKERAPQQIARVVMALGAYQRLLASAARTTEHVVEAGRFTWLWRAKLLLRLPVAMLGLILNWLPYRIAGCIGARAQAQPDQPATHKLMAGLILFPLFWLLETWLAWQYLGRVAVLSLLGIAPVSGYVALRFDERRRSFREDLEFQKILRSQAGFESELVKHRAAVVSELEALRDANRELFF